MSTPRRSATDEHAPADAERRWRLEDELDFLERSLSDLGAERDAGDIDERDFQVLAARDTERLSSVRAELEALDAAERARLDGPPEPTAAPGAKGRRRRRRWLAVVGVVALSAGATLLAVHLASPRLPGQPPTGSIALSVPKRIEMQLGEASLLVDEGTKRSLAEALGVYRSVLAEDPRQPQALAETGWLEWEAGHARGDTALEDAGRTLVQRSIAVEHDDFAAHLFMGTIDLEQEHDPVAAVGQYRLFLAEKPPKAEVTSAAALIRQAFAEAGQSDPPGLG